MSEPRSNYPYTEPPPAKRQRAEGTDAMSIAAWYRDAYRRAEQERAELAVQIAAAERYAKMLRDALSAMNRDNNDLHARLRRQQHDHQRERRRWLRQWKRRYSGE